VCEAVDFYFRGLWDAARTLDALRFYDLNDQMCFVAQSLAMTSLRFVGSYEVTR
jgi:hypothetical protein